MVAEGEVTQKSTNDKWEEVPHYLFLIEFFVYHINSDRLAELNNIFCTPTRILFNFPNVDDEEFEVFRVNEHFIAERKLCKDVECINSGQSMLFAESKAKFDDQDDEFLIYLYLEKNESENLNIEIASAALDFTEQFRAIKQSAKTNWTDKTLPEAQIFDGEVPLKYQKNHVGSVKVLLRLSALGEAVNTDFDSSASECASTFIFTSDLIPKDVAYECKVQDPCSQITKPSCSDLMEICRDKRSGTSSCRCSSCLGSLADNDSRKLIQTSRGKRLPNGTGVVLKVSGVCGDGESDSARVQVAPESEAISPELAAKHDVFVLRIGKKGIVGPGEKSDLQLELKTPRSGEIRPPIRCETREVQTEENQKKKKELNNSKKEVNKGKEKSKKESKKTSKKLKKNKKKKKRTQFN